MIGGAKKSKKPKAKQSQYSSEGSFIPSILRRGKPQSKKSSEEIATQAIQKKRFIIESHDIESNAQLAIDMLKRNQLEFADLYERARELLKDFPAPAEKNLDKTVQTATTKAPNYPEAVLKSRLFCNETLDDVFDSAQRESAPAVIIKSPFSKAKERAHSAGVNLGDECRGVYSEQELNRRIDLLAKFKS